jgi:CRP/FNR family transcriptional regulator, cyclic AMP receptor protein
VQQELRISALKRVGIIADLPDAAIARIVALCRWRHFMAGELILGYQDTTRDVLFLADGKARVVIHSADGRAVIFTDLEPGAMFGELAAIDGKPRSASVVALEPCLVAALTGEQFERLLIEEPRVALATLRRVIAEVRRLTERVLEFSTLSVRQRIRAELLRLAAASGGAQGEALIAPIPTLDEIASRVSTHREAVSRELAALVRTGLLRRAKGGLVITDVGRLARLVHDAKTES